MSGIYSVLPREENLHFFANIRSHARILAHAHTQGVCFCVQCIVYSSIAGLSAVAAEYEKYNEHLFCRVICSETHPQTPTHKQTNTKKIAYKYAHNRNRKLPFPNSNIPTIYIYV